MEINILELIEIIKNNNLNTIPSYVKLGYSELGFYLIGETPEETTILNKKYKWLTTTLNNKTNKTEPFLKVSEIATFLKTSKNTIYDILDDEEMELSYYDIKGKGIRIKIEDLMYFLEKCYVNKKK